MTDIIYPVNACSHPGTLPSDCPHPPVTQYRKYGDNQQDIHAFFACTEHAYTVDAQMIGVHRNDCTLFPCDCTPYVDPPNPLS